MDKGNHITKLYNPINNNMLDVLDSSIYSININCRQFINGIVANNLEEDFEDESFKIENLKCYLPSSFKGLSFYYMLYCIFNKDIQKKWVPKLGDIIVGETGNIFVISNVDNLHESIGGTRYYFGGGSCNRDGGNVLDSTYSSTANESGIYYHPIDGEQQNYYHSSIRDFRYVPYYHELQDLLLYKK